MHGLVMNSMDVIMPIVCGVAIEVLLLVGMVGPLMFSFKDGKLCRTEDNSLARFITKRSTVLAAILSFAVYCVVAFYYKREFATSFRWEIAAGLLVLVTLFDRACNIIPNKILFLPLVLAPLLILIDILLNPNLWRSSVGTYLIAALMGGGIFFISRFITHGGIGAGDIKLMFVLGLLLGVKGYINVLIYSMLAVFIYSVALLITKRGSLNDRIALGPFVFLGFMLSVMFGAC